MSFTYDYALRFLNGKRLIMEFHCRGVHITPLKNTIMYFYYNLQEQNINKIVSCFYYKK